MLVERIKQAVDDALGESCVKEKAAGLELIVDDLIDEVERLKMLLDTFRHDIEPLWPTLNRERGNLIDSGIAGSLTEVQELRLKLLSAIADLYC